MDREPPGGARRRWTIAELVPEQPGERSVREVVGFSSEGRSLTVTGEAVC